MEADEPVTVRLEITDGITTWTQHFGGLSASHSDVTVLGFHAGATHTITATIIDAAGNETQTESPLSFTTAALPLNFPPVMLTVYDTASVEPGYVMFSLFNSNYIVILDLDGKVVWYTTAPGGKAAGVYRTAAGNLLYWNYPAIVEIDMRGNVVASWLAAGEVSVGPTDIQLADVPIFHHEAYEMSNGNILTLTQEQQPVDNFPTSETDQLAQTATKTVLADIIVEFQRNGTEVNRWHVLNMLQPTRVGYKSVFETVSDWSHGNALLYDASDDTILYSARHQDAVVKFRRNLTNRGAVSDLVWILGDHANWNSTYQPYLLTPTNFANFPYHQHAPLQLRNGDIMIFDNGNYGASPFDGTEPLPPTENCSRVVQYSIDKAAMEITQVWQYGERSGEAECIYVPYLGDVDELPTTGNIFITFGGISVDKTTGEPLDKTVDTKVYARLVEVTHASPPRKVMEVLVGTTNHMDNRNTPVYRAERLNSLYP